MDLVGVTRTIDHAVYMLLNALAIILWRLDAALIGISLFSYNTQDWLTGDDGGVWRVMAKLVGAEGIFGLATWQACLVLALVLFGFSRVVRPFLRVQPVDPGRLFLFAVLAYVVISQGSELMQAVEAWRAEAGSYMYAELSSGDTVDLEIPGSAPPSMDEPLYSPQDLDGRVPIRGWEAVATSYFLVQHADELHDGVPSHDFRVAYCLYDPNEPIGQQDEENAAGCSPKKAWDEWDQISLTQPITQVWGIPLPGSISLDIPLVQEHPENRQLAIRQVQSGVARLALGPVVALFPMVEANIALMLALAASFIYLSLPITLIFGFFLYTESMATRLLLQLINVIIRTLILNGLVAVFLMLLMSVSINGSLMAYLGLIGVGLAGGFLLMRFAASTMKETFSQALGAVGGIWMGAAVATMGQGAARPARTALGLAKLGTTAAVLGAAGGRAFDLAEAGLHSARSGARDLNRSTPSTMNQARRAAARLPAPLARLARSGLTPPADSSEPETVRAAGPLPAQLAHTSPAWSSSGTPPGGTSLPAVPTPSPNGVTSRDTTGPREDRVSVEARYSQAERQAVWRAAQQVAAEDRSGELVRPDGSLTVRGVQAVQGRLDEQVARTFSGEQGRRDLATLVAEQQRSARAGGLVAYSEQRQAGIEEWAGQVYRAREQGRDQQRVSEAGRDLLGEELGREAERAMTRHGQAETRAVLKAARQAAAEGNPGELLQDDGRLTTEGIQAVRARLDEQTSRAFSDQQGQQDLAVLTAVSLQRQKQAPPAEFRRAAATAPAGSGEQAPGRTVPRALGLDPVASGMHFANLNRFARLSEQAGLTAEQRQRLLAEVRQGQVSTSLRGEIETALRRQQDEGRGTGLKVDDLLTGAQALPETLAGPMQVRMSGGRVAVVDRSPAGKPSAASGQAEQSARGKAKSPAGRTESPARRKAETRTGQAETTKRGRVAGPTPKTGERT